MMPVSRRDFIRSLGVSSATLPFVLNLPSLAFANQTKRKQRLLILFSPNGTVVNQFWPDQVGKDFQLKAITKPLERFRDQMLFLHGVHDRVRGDGDAHMRGIGCLLTGIELFPGNIQGGSDTPAGWSSGHSIDQEIKNFLQKDPATRTRFGSLEFGVMVPERADTWTRMVYAGPNKPIAPIDNPYQMFNKLYGRTKDNQILASVLDDLTADLKKVSGAVSQEDRRLLDEHATLVREMEVELKQSSQSGALNHPVPQLEAGIKEEAANLPKLSKMQLDLIVNSFLGDFTRVATLQYTNSVGNVPMRWLGVDEGHHELSHEPDSNEKAQEKLVKINTWYCEQIAYLCKRLADTPEPGSTGSMLDHTTILWTNELGKGNSHTLNNIPWMMVGGGLNFKMGRSLKYNNVAHNRLLISLAHAFGHHIEQFGKPDFSSGGPLNDLT
ncbi:DUF1552 domain-containing protein [Tuwongella immobilis]|uniref:DUF1552 domain-containing protein n=1 Tax=Tuwongella immobilis TaxID=692036 RepID=A0A6C2YQB8_9BACT|nr:DUF1552 domain-containing protein [Tuwongella immobilis]VIP03547.1 Uncharacterized protein OS=Singulisphaera acidiphila (strain ATCC BAA-1392 / DSM 18658 / VKM B-2454 / MOB10) GN=Sinac_0938 PE=4 SV=1: HXXSHH [Tuwongella immobilis]VTS04462.1 Uncharacterized protein OS=Singulisphaera acidiphila (strain ATCC BAA-1392 / DSM 18658 / VKM B-2454 / MOB10) GN=Sinac_0938 PE=4 SV=1: HXXSHH [Tuwongella immobilis]